MKIIKIAILLAFVLSITAMTCKRHEADCTNAMCTNEYRTISVLLRDNQIPARQVDKVEVILNGLPIFTQTAPPVNSTQSVTVVEDGMLSNLGYNSTNTVELRIFMQGQMVKAENYEIKTDCCHINKMSGPEEIVLP